LQASAFSALFSAMAYQILKAYLWFIAAFHLVVGLAVNLSPSLTQAIARGYGATVDWTPQFTYILHPLGAFMIALGVMAIAAARDPRRYSAVVGGFVLLFAIRALHRVVFGSAITAAFGISSSRNMINMVVFAAQAVLLFVLWRAAMRDAGTQPA
jgi:hypothetical protein